MLAAPSSPVGGIVFAAAVLAVSTRRRDASKVQVSGGWVGSVLGDSHAASSTEPASKVGVMGSSLPSRRIETMTCGPKPES
jgi:hypothetical protein